MDGLLTWRDAAAVRGEILKRVPRSGWEAQLVRSGLGVVGFVFEGCPNVFADATGVLRSGNTVVFRIGSAALGTARAIIEHALDPALAETGLPEGAVGLVDSPTHAVGWALFSQPKLSLPVARGSGRAVGQLGAVARQSGVAVSLHGTGGSWMVVGLHADPSRFADELAPVFLDALQNAAGRRNVNPKLWVTEGDEGLVPSHWFRSDTVTRAEGEATEPITETLSRDRLGIEWEWEESPEVTLTLVESVSEAVELFNRHSPKLVASLIDDDPNSQERFYETVDAPFVGNGFTRWVDGQFALNRPELGLSKLLQPPPRQPSPSPRKTLENKSRPLLLRQRPRKPPRPPASLLQPRLHRPLLRFPKGRCCSLPRSGSALDIPGPARCWSTASPTVRT